MLRYFYAIILMFGLGDAALAAPVEEPSRIFTANDLFLLEVASSPKISPDGSKIAYVRRSGDIMTDQMRASIWLIDTATGEQKPIATGPGSHSQPAWSPDGKRLAYISSAEGNGAQLFIRWMESGETARITNLPDTPDSIAWSPDGRQIAYSMFVPGDGMKLGGTPSKPEGAKWAEPLEIYSAITYRADGAGYLKPGYNHIFLVPADGGAPRQISFGSVHDDGPLSWSPDGKTLYFSSNRSPNWEREPFESEIFALDIASLSIRPLTSRKGPDFNPVASPDGSKIAYLGYDDRKLPAQNSLLYVMDTSGNGARVLTQKLDRSIDSLTWSADGQSLYVSYDDHGTTLIARVGLDGSVRKIVEGLSGSSLDRPYTGGSFSVARNGKIAATSGSATRPADIVTFQNGVRQPLTRLNAALLDHKIMGEVKKITFASSFDQKPIEAWLTFPPNAQPGQKHPLILEIHGGPYQAYGPHFSTDNQLYAAAGYVVLSVNPRGSTSYGEDFANIVHNAYPSQDYDDLMSAVDTVIAQGIADPERLFVTGGSGGGILTAWIIGKTNRFKAAATQKPVIDWVSFALTTDGAIAVSPYFFFEKKPWEDQQRYWAHSPLSLMANVKTPTLVVVGSQDYRTPASEAEQYYNALQLAGVPTAFVKVPGAGHSTIAARPSQSGAKASAILAWFEKYKDGAPGTAAKN